MLPLTRRSVLAGLAGTGVLATAPALAGVELASAYQSPILKFQVQRDGSPIGIVMERFQARGNQLQVDVYIEFVVKLAFIPVYRYEHRSREIWDGGRLVRLDTVTNDDGDAQMVEARPRGDLLAISGPSGDITAPGDILPSSYWHPKFMQQSRMLDSQKGRILEFTIVDKGVERIGVQGGQSTEASRYAMRGDIDLDFWYDFKDRWRKMSFTIKGGFMEYFEMAPALSDQDLFGSPLSTGARVAAL
jgi:hypothetical protein